MRAHERRVGKIDEDVLRSWSGTRLELPAALDTTLALRDRHDRLDAAHERARHDAGDLTISQMPDQLARDDAARFVERAKAIDAG